MSDDVLQTLKDELFDAVRRGYTGAKPWPQPAGLAPVDPEVIATDPPHMRRISRIHQAVCDVLDRYDLVGESPSDAELWHAIKAGDVAAVQRFMGDGNTEEEG